MQLFPSTHNSNNRREITKKSYGPFDSGKKEDMIFSDDDMN